MILDSSLTLDPAGSAITASRVSTNTIDIGNARDIGVHHRNLYIQCQVTATFVGAGASLMAQWQGSVDNTTWLTIVESPATPTATLALGRRLLDMQVPRQSPNPDTPAGMFRYFRINYVVTGGSFTAGAIMATIVLEKQDTLQYPKNFNVTA